ncbi:MAG TPA: hypothetical protein VLB84_09620 [Bacteroidia bacterium]|nr:hypothetical protein [Bacteroidia bacterium]
MLVVSYKDYLSDEIKTKYFIINNSTEEEMQINEGEMCYEQIKGAAFTRINDLDEEVFGKLLIQ